ncbi:DUF3649 domain-containing protein [Granulibacter bethesdensis]|uniref:DUF3649 domain-containing protein n=1 Tax=Granulibacter bethesdensis TaxID=364410 RepID=UPI0003F1E1D6|nr:DUF3649 domain-containing protein [Granulibacter bethesdensis]AHJ66076.1 Hypothetical protein GbCGDNIH4_1458 [Granulibacter bethesdensis CGDNIH4]
MQGRRWGVFSRIMAAIIGGYCATLAINAALAVLLPLPRAEAVIIAAMLSFPVFAGVIIWVFATRSPGRAWAGLALVTLPCAALGYWSATHPATPSTLHSDGGTKGKHP